MSHRARSGTLRSVVCAAALTIAAGSRCAIAAELVQVGFDGGYRTGSWTPLVVAVPDDGGPANPGGTAFCSVEDADGQWLTSPPSPVVVDADGRPQARFCVRFGRPSGRVLVHRGPQPRGEPPLQLPSPLPSTDTVFLVLGDVPGIDRAARLLTRDDGSRPRIIAPSQSAAPLGLSPRDFDGADVILVSGRAAKERGAMELEAIDGWVRRGGRLVFIAGGSAAGIATAGGTAATWLPGAVKRLAPLRRSAPIEVFARCTRPMDRGLLSGLEVPVFEDAAQIDGNIVAYDGAKPTDLPIVIRRSHGLGTIAWIGVDIDQAGFRTWAGTDSLLVELLGGVPKSRAGRAGETNRLTLDLGGQLRRGIDRFPGVGPVPFSVIALLGGLAIVSLYPVTWWLVRQTGPGMAWMALPVLALAAGAVVWRTGRQWHGAGWETSAAGVVDLDATDGLARGLSWAGIWSPDNAAVDVVAGPPTELAVSETDAVVSWYADAGRGLGATDAPVAHPSLAAADYTYGATMAELAGVPIAAASSRLFEAEWGAALASSPVTAALAIEAQGTLRGTLAHHLPFPLEDCVLVHGGWLYPIGRLEPGQSYDPASGRGPRSLASALTRRTQSKDRDVVSRWDVADTDVGQILEVAGFHAAAGGAGYTSLESGRLALLDLSPHLEMGRAVLVGFGPPGGRWSLGGTAAPNDASPSAAPTMWRILMRLKTGREPSQP